LRWCRIYKFALSRNNIVGIPDFIIEVLSPGSVAWDKKVKLKKYLEAGVQEYWIVDYSYEEVLVYSQNKSSEHSFDETIEVGIFEDLSIDFALIKQKVKDAWWN